MLHELSKRLGLTGEMKMKTKKSECLDALMGLPVETIQKSLLSPSKDMLDHPVLMAIHKIAIRKKTGRVAFDFIHTGENC